MSTMNEQRRKAPPGGRLRPLPAVIRHSLLASASALLANTALLGQAVAAPQGGNVMAGQGQISTPDATTTLVHQQSHSMIVNWQSFDVAKPEIVQFNQPSSSAAVLNRVLNHSASQIHGAVRANGQVFILNSSGVVIGKDARVDVGGLVVSSLDISNSDFMQGRYSFKATDGQTPGAIVNRGLIQAARGGVTLVGGQVSNEGVIVADMGHVNLAAGRTATVDFDGDGLVRFEVDGEVLANASGADAAVSNTGEIRAEGGQVLLSARVASQVFDRAVNNTGLIRAGGIQKVGGKVTLTGFGAGVKNTGIVDASGTSGGEVRVISDAVIEQFGAVRADGSSGDGGLVHLASLDTTLVGGNSVSSARSESAAGGRVQIEGARVGLLGSARVDVSGLSAGGTVLAGGGYQGKDAQVRNATATVMDSGVTIDADARGNGDGGTVILWADDVTRFLGAISARGGAAGGDGGFVETSGKNILQAWGIVDVATRAGASSGTWLLDPANVEIVNAAAGTGSLDGVGNPFTATAADGTVSNGSINAALNAGGGVNVVITTNVDLGAGNQAGNITQAAGATISKTAGTDATLTLNAANTITLTETISSSAGVLNVVLSANDAAQVAHDLDANAGDVVINAAITTLGGAFTASGVNVSSTVAGTITTDAAATSGASGGAVNIDATTGNVSLAGAISALGDGAGGGGQVAIDAEGAGTVAVAAIDASGGAGASTGGAINLNSAGGTGAVTLNGNLSATGAASGGAVTVTTAALLGGPVTVNTGAAGGAIAFSGAIDNAQALLLSAGTGAVTLGGAAGGVTPLSSLTISGATASLQAVTTSGAQSYNGATTLNGDLTTATGGSIVLGDVTLGSAVTLDTNATTAAGSITLGAVTAGANALTLRTGAGADLNGTTFSGGAGSALNLANIGGTATFTGNVTAGTLSVPATVLNAAFTGNGNTIANLVTYGNTGTLVLGQGGGTQTYNGGLNTTGVGGVVTLHGTIASSNDAIVLGAVTLGSAVTLDTNATTDIADLTIGIVSGGNNTLTLDTGNVADADITTGALNAIGALSVRDAGDVTFGGVVGAASLTQAAGAGTTTFNGVVTSATAISIITNAITINEAMTANTNVTLTAVNDIDVTAPGAGNRDVTATNGNINVTSTAGTIFLRDTATPSRARLVAAGGGAQQVNTFGTLVIENNDATNAPQIVADLLGTSVAGNLFLGNDSSGTPTFDDATMDALLAGAGTGLTFTSTGGDIIIDRANPFSGNLSLIANGSIDDAGVGLAFQNTSGTLTLAAGTTIGAAGDGLQIDVANLIVTDASTVNVTNAGSGGGATYSLGTNSPLGATTIVQGANTAAIAQASSSASLSVSANAIDVTGLVNVAALNFDASGGAGAITDSGAGRLVVSGVSTLSAQASDAITLDATDNDFGGAVSVTNANNVTLVDASAIDLGASTVTGNLTVTAGGAVSDSGALSVSGTTTVNAVGNAITLDTAGNDFVGAVSTSGSAVMLVDTNAIVLGATMATVSLSVTAGGAVTQSGDIDSNGTTTLSAVGQDITLDRAGNDFTGAVSSTGANVSLRDANALELGATTATASLSVTAGGAVTQSGDIDSDGATTLSATGNAIMLTRAGNDFTGAVSLTGAAVTLVDVNALVLGASTASSLSVTANGAITQTAALSVSGVTTLAAGAANDITLDQAANDFGGAVAVSSGNDVTLVDANALDLGAGTISGNLSASATSGGITDSGVFTVAGNSVFTAPNASIMLDSANTFTGTVQFVGPNLVNVTVNDTSALDLQALTLSGNLNVTSGGAVTDSGTMSIGGTTTVNAAGNDITLDEAGNDFIGAVSSTGANVTLVDVNALVLGTTAASAGFTVTAGGAITQAGAGIASPFVTASSVGGTALSNAGNTFALFDATNTGSGAVAVTTGAAGGLDIAATGITTPGNITIINNTGAITQTGNLSGAVLSTTSTGGTTLGGANTVSGFSASNAGGGNVTLNNTGTLALGTVTSGGGALSVTNAGTVNVTAGSNTGGGALSVTSSAGAINGAGGTLNSGAGALVLSAATGIGTTGAVNTVTGTTLELIANGGNIAVNDDGFATSQLIVRTPAASRIVTLGGPVTFNTPTINGTDTANDIFNFTGPVAVTVNIATGGASLNFLGAAPLTVLGGGTIDLGAGNLTLSAGASASVPLTLSAAGTTLGGGAITMPAGALLNINSPLLVAGASSVFTDALVLGGAVTGAGDLSVLRVSASAADTTLGGTDPIFSTANLARFSAAYTGVLNVGGTRDTPPSAAQLLNDITITSPLSTGGDVFVVGAGDIRFTGAGRISTPGTVSLVALGSVAVPGSGNIRDDNSLPAGVAPNFVSAGTLELLAANQIGSESGAEGGTFNFQAATVSAAQGVAGDALVDNANRSAGASESVLDVQRVYAVAGAPGAGLGGLFNDAFRNIGAVATLSVTTISTPKQAKGELGFIDEGVFLLPSAFTSPERAVLMPLLGDADFPADQRPQDPNDEDEWLAFFEEVLRAYVAARHPLAENATAEERAAVEAMITSELQLIIEYYEAVRARERTQLAQDAVTLDAVPLPLDQAPGLLPGADPIPPPAPALQQGQLAPVLEPGYVGQPWSAGGIGVERRGWPHGSVWPMSVTPLS